MKEEDSELRSSNLIANFSSRPPEGTALAISITSSEPSSRLVLKAAQISYQTPKTMTANTHSGESAFTNLLDGQLGNNLMAAETEEPFLE